MLSFFMFFFVVSFFFLLVYAVSSIHLVLMKLILFLENDTDQKPDKSRIIVHHRGRRQMIDFFSYFSQSADTTSWILICDLKYELNIVIVLVVHQYNPSKNEEKKSIIYGKRKQSKIEIAFEHQKSMSTSYQIHSNAGYFLN